MDINTSAGLLMNFFETHDSFNFETDYKKLNWSLLKDDDSPESEQQASILGALVYMEKENILHKVDLSNGTKDKNKFPTYVILNSKKHEPIQIEISKETAESMVNIVNSFLPMIDVNIKERSNIQSLSEAEIILLIQVVTYMAQQISENKKEVKTEE